MDLRIVRSMPNRLEWNYWYTPAADKSPILLSARHYIGDAPPPQNGSAFTSLLHYAFTLSAISIDMIFGCRELLKPSMLGIKLSAESSSRMPIDTHLHIVETILLQAIVETLEEDDQSVNAIQIAGCQSGPVIDCRDPNDLSDPLSVASLTSWILE